VKGGAVVSLTAKKTAFKEMDFETIFPIVDEAERLYESVYATSYREVSLEP
jgi:hypothetical protein